MNCPARHPEHVSMPRRVLIRPLGFWYEYAPRRRGHWMAGYPMEANLPDGKVKTLRVVIDDVVSDECPRSILIRDPGTRDLIQIFNQSRTVRGAMGSASLWPGRFFDATLLLHEQHLLDKNARMSAR